MNTTQNELLELCHNGKLVTDKYIGTLQFHSYIENFYSKVLPSRKYTTMNLLEIGIAGGGSLWLWEKFFPAAHIYALDIDSFMPMKFKGQPRIHAEQGDAYSPEIVAKFKDGMFDIIIDDGPHTLESQCLFLDLYLPKLAPGGLIIIEDIFCEEHLEHIAWHVPEHLQNKIGVHDTCHLDHRFDSRILYIET